jgi:hypothetical protein
LLGTAALARCLPGQQIGGDLLVFAEFGFPR